MPGSRRVTRAPKPSAIAAKKQKPVRSTSAPWLAGGRALVSGAWTLASQRRRIRELEALVAQGAKQAAAT